MKLRPTASPATVISIIALILACSGTAVAGSALITGKQVRDNSLTGLDVRNGSIKRADLDPAARASTASPATAAATAAATGKADVQLRNASAIGVGPLIVRCPAGERALGGGGNALELWKSQPLSDDQGNPVGWVVQGKYPVDWNDEYDYETGQPIAHADPNVVAYVICTKAS